MWCAVLCTTHAKLLLSEGIRMDIIYYGWILYIMCKGGDYNRESVDSGRPCLSLHLPCTLSPLHRRVDVGLWQGISARRGSIVRIEVSVCGGGGCDMAICTNLFGVFTLG